jgi:signal peptidase I
MDNLPNPQEIPPIIESAATESLIVEPVTTPIRGRAPVVAFLLELIQTLILAAILYVMIDTVIARVRVENISMRPTLEPGEFLLVNKLAYKTGSMSRGDIVVFHYNITEDYIKRIIGLPGDTVEVQNGSVRVNQIILNEPYISAPPGYNGVWEVPAGSLFVLGDNRNQSSDSHAWGFVSLDKLVGKALVIYWPIKNAKVLTHANIVNAAQ